MDFAFAELSPRQRYKLMTAAIVPRPIAWVSTRDASGARNLAPFSYFNAVGSDPPTLLFSGGRHADGRPKDSVAIAVETGEFVVNLVTEDLLEAMNRTAITAPREFDEFAFAGVTPAASVAVAAPRVAEAKVAFECTLAQLVEIGGSRVVFGEIVHAHLSDDIYLGDHKIDPLAYRPVGRLAGGMYARLGELVTLERPRWPEDARDGESG